MQKSLWVAFLLFSALSEPVMADGIPLGEIRYGAGEAGSISAPIAYESFALYYGNLVDQSAPCVGCNLYLPIGTKGTFDFSASNDPEFTSFVQELTNGIDQLLSASFLALDASGNPQTGSSGGNLESGWFGTPTDLIGDQIDHVRLRINSVTIVENAVPEFSTSYDVIWQFWGSGTPFSHVPVPEPSSLFFCVMGIPGIVFIWRKQLLGSRA